MTDSKKLTRRRIWSDGPKESIEEFKKITPKEMKRVKLSSTKRGKN